MGRERQDFKRKSGFRDAKLIVIATEGEKTEPKYFEALISDDQFYNPRVHVEVLGSVDGKTSPSHVIALMDEFRREYRIREDDELWILVDRDFQSWKTGTLSECMRLCRQKNYHFGLSNPCFEIWLILHFTCISTLDESEKLRIKENKRQGQRNYCEKLIVQKIGSFNKANPSFDAIIPHTHIAIERAERLTKGNTVDLLKEIGTNVFVLIRSLTPHNMG